MNKEVASQNYHFPVPRGRAQYYNLPDQKRFNASRGNWSCDSCNKSFFNKMKYDQHLEEHVECPFPECGLKAHIKIIDSHITNQHMLVNFEALQMDDEAWIRERKKRFPTQERAELRRNELQERLNRGERIGIDKKKGFQNKFNKKQNKDFDDKKEKIGLDEKSAPSDSNRNDNNRRKKNRRERNLDKSKTNNNNNNNNIRPTKEEIENQLYESDTDNRFGVPAFQGTKKFYEDSGELSYFSNKNPSRNDHDNLDISDDEEWDMNEDVNIKEVSSNSKLNNALGSIMGAYSDSDDEVEEINENKNNSSIKQENQSTPVNQLNNNEIHKSDSLYPDKNENDKKRKWNKRRNHDNKAKTKNEHKPFKRRKTLLERLLEPDIRHERNVMLQCIRFIVQNNFFDKT